MPGTRASVSTETLVSRERLVELLNEDIAREYQAIISYVVYSQVVSGADYVNITAKFEEYAMEELRHALTLAKLIGYLGRIPTIQPSEVRVPEKAKDILRLDLEKETEAIHNYCDRILQCEALGEYAMAKQIREILAQEQQHQIGLAAAIGIGVARAKQSG